MVLATYYSLVPKLSSLGHEPKLHKVFKSTLKWGHLLQSGYLKQGCSTDPKGGGIMIGGGGC